MSTYQIIMIVIGILSLLVNVVTFAYHKSEWAYLAIQRILFFFRRNGKVILTASIRLNSKEIQSEIESKIRKTEIIDGKFIDNFKKIKLNDSSNARIFDIKLDQDTYGRTNLWIKGKYPIYKQDYEIELENLRHIYNNFKDSIHSNDSDIDFMLYFEKSNPYEGFFVKQIPGQNVKKFNLEYIKDGVRIDVEKHIIKSAAKNIDKLIKHTIDILSLKSNLIHN